MKLLMKFDGPFEIIQKFSPTTYRLQMPASYGIHPVLNVAHLKIYHASDPALGNWPTKHLGRANFVDLPEYEVEYIVAEHWHKSKNGRHVQELLTHFTGYDSSYDEWLPRRHLRNAPELLRDWDCHKSTRSDWRERSATY